MSQLSLLLPSSAPDRPEAETGVRVAWALDRGRPVHIERYSHLRDGGARHSLSCLGCSVPVIPVLPPRGKGRPHRLDHFRHKARSPDCWAGHGQGAMLWNAALHLHLALQELPPALRGRLHIRAFCDPAQSPWSTLLPLFSVGCDQHHALDLPAWDRAALSPTRRGSPKVPDIRLFHGEIEVLRVRLTTAGEGGPPTHEVPPVVIVRLDDATYRRLLAWDPSSSPRLPCSSASPALTWQCAAHRG